MKQLTQKRKYSSQRPTAKRQLLQMLKILEMLSKNPLCVNEIMSEGHFSYNDIRPILDALIRKELLFVTVEKRTSRSRRPAYIHYLTSKGVKALEKWALIKEAFGAEKLEDLA